MHNVRARRMDRTHAVRVLVKNLVRRCRGGSLTLLVDDRGLDVDVGLASAPVGGIALLRYRPRLARYCLF
jgi:hypothetical protein